jgi:hypothetical protein
MKKDDVSECSSFLGLKGKKYVQKKNDVLKFFLKKK